MSDTPKGESEGLGDSVEKLIHKVSGGKIKPCGGCEKRKKWLNEVMPYSKQKEPKKKCSSCEEKRKKRKEEEEFSKRADPSNFHIED